MEKRPKVVQKAKAKRCVYAGHSKVALAAMFVWPGSTLWMFMHEDRGPVSPGKIRDSGKAGREI